MTEQRSEDRDLAAMRAVVIAAAIRYRDAMRQYLAEQAETMDRGASLDVLVMRNWQSFQEVSRAEEELFALLDLHEARRRRAESEEREKNRGM